MHRFRLYISLLLCLGVAACTADRRDSLNGKGADQATFIVEDIGGQAEQGNIREGTPWNIATTVHADFNVRLKDGASNQWISKQDFFVGVPGTTIGWTVQTDEFGFLHWPEDLPFNQFAGQSGWVSLKRTVTGRGTNTGTVTVDIGVNPWAAGSGGRDSGDAIINLKKRMPERLIPADEGAHFLSGDSKSQGAAQLIIQDVKIQAIPEAEGNGFVTLGYNITMKPKIRTRNFFGKYFYADVPDGDFNIWLQVLAAQAGAKMDERVLILGGEPFTVGKVVDGVLRAEVRIRQERRANQGSLELAMKVAPRSLSSLATVKPFNGVYRLGSGTVVEDGSGSIKKECLDEGSNACEFSRIVESARNYGDLVKSGYLKPNQRYVFNNLRLRFLMVQPGETATQRTVAYTASTCITDIQTGKALANTPLIIRYVKNDKQHAEVERDVIPKNTDDLGCLSWDGMAFHKYYQPEQYFERIVSIEKASGFKEEFKFYLNPWDTNINFGFDKREFTPEKVAEITNRPPIESRFFIGGYQYHTVRFLYNIDPFMDLEVKKTILLEFAPEVLRYSGIKDARKMTEHLRDGIYLLKVAIQKSYLDPRDNSHLTISDEKYHAVPKKIGGRELASKEYITTNVTLVRVVSGLIIVPIELTMRDLRLMRVRSNFILQLETVDERLIQAYHVFKEHAIQGEKLEEKLNEFREKIGKGATLDDVKKELGDTPLNPEIKNLVEQRNKLNSAEGADKARKALEDAITDTQNSVGASLLYLKQQLEGKSPLSTYLNASGKDTGVPEEALKDSSIVSDFELDPKMLAGLKTALNVNDFSKVALPPKEDIDLNLFIEKDAGLKKRSFVGPVIFLSNAYSDSVRATDNMDEAGCADPSKSPDALKLSREALYSYMKEAQVHVFGNPQTDGVQASSQYPAIWLPETQLEGKRQNNAYQFSEFFGALTHLCYKQVDDLIAKEKEVNRFREDQATATSLKSNFIEFLEKIGMNLDFVSLTDEPLVRLKKGCDGRPAQCLETTTEGTVPFARLADWINKDLTTARLNANRAMSGLANWWKGRTQSSERTEPWTKDEYQKIFFERSPDSRVAICNLLANRLAERVTKKGLLSELRLRFLRTEIVGKCAAENGLIQDIKYHVTGTGQYTFLGGLNLNINVGEGFSTSWSRSWSAGIEWADVVSVLSMAGGAAAKSAVGTVLKPVSLKQGVSMSDSEGTSINESTYLVSQIAGFQVELSKYEKCVMVGISPEAVRRLTLGSGNFRNTGIVADDFRSGLMVCEGATRDFNPPTNVKESYFYFTQHFTEGDMLDQAELYNHPWLLGMRGMRDFVAFSNRVRAQEVVGFGEFLSGVTGATPEKKKAWALNHMTWIYENVFPSFPGFYTVLERGEDIQAFLLEQSQSQLTKVDRDPLGEVTRRQTLINPGVSQMGIGPGQK